MNKIVRTEILAGELPERLRPGIDPATSVIVTVEADATPRSWEALSRRMKDYRRRRPPRFGTSEEAAEYVRAVRDGGDLSPWLQDDSTSTPTS